MDSVYKLQQKMQFSDTKNSVESHYSNFIKGFVFHRVGISRMIYTKEKIDIAVD